MPGSDQHGQPATLWLVRHGQTDWNVAGRYQGQADPPLNATGLAEAGQAAESMAHQPLAAIYTSDLQRAEQTAQVIARRAGMAYQLEPLLREVRLGDWEGQLYRHIEARYPQLIAARSQDPLDFRPPNGESLREVAKRVWAVADRIAARYPGQQVTLVSHGLALAAILTRAGGEDLALAFHRIPPNAAPQPVQWPPRVEEGRPKRVVSEQES